MHCLYSVGRCVVEEANIKDAPNSNYLPVLISVFLIIILSRFVP